MSRTRGMRGMKPRLGHLSSKTTGMPLHAAGGGQVREAIARRAGDKSAAARDLGVSRATLYRWLEQRDGRARV